MNYLVIALQHILLPLCKKKKRNCTVQYESKRKKKKNLIVQDTHKGDA